jgi:predicted DNA-binding protein (UPF0251 family)
MNNSLLLMPPRSRTPRRISEPPVIKGFKPFGDSSGDIKLKTINLLLEEYEALRLCDYEHFNHEEAAELMGVSRPTFTRIYASALEKIASSFVKGQRIIIEGGHVYFDSKWCFCNDCECRFSNPFKKEEKITCPLCGSGTVSFVKENAAEGASPMTSEGNTGCGLNECI